MFNHTYQTTVCNAYLTREIVSELERAKVNNELNAISYSEDVYFPNLFEVTPYSKAVPAFHHPIEIIDSQDQKLIVVDQRPNMGMDRNGIVRVTNKTQYDFLALRGLFEMMWNNGFREEFSVTGSLPIKTYCRMLSENIRRRLGLDATEQQSLMALSAYFYFCQFRTDSLLTSDDRLSLATRIRNNILVPVDVTLSILDQIDPLKDLNDYCAAIRTVIPNPRVAKINPAFIITVNMGQWYGGNAKEVIAVALEYPPAFLAIVYTALTDRSMYSAMLSKLVDSLSKNNSGQEFRQAIQAMMKAASD